jgi:hypothetical protein
MQAPIALLAKPNHAVHCFLDWQESLIQQCRLHIEDGPGVYLELLRFCSVSRLAPQPRFRDKLVILDVRLNAADICSQLPLLLPEILALCCQLPRLSLQMCLSDAAAVPHLQQLVDPC